MNHGRLANFYFAIPRSFPSGEAKKPLCVMPGFVDANPNPHLERLRLAVSGKIDDYRK
jgi:hypothetical protein